MDKIKIFGYVSKDVDNFIEETKHYLKQEGYIQPSKSKIIELALRELMEKNDSDSIGWKLNNRGMIYKK